MKVSLFPYQAALASQVLKEFESGRSNVVLAAACGAGKTITSISICEELLKKDPNLRILVLTHGQVILRTQFVNDIEEQQPDFTHTVVKSCRDLEKKVQVYVGLPHTIRRCTEHKFDVIIVDEAHHFYFCPNGMVQRIIENSKPRFTLFLTGSPSQFIKQRYRLHSISLLELFQLGRVCSPVVELAKTTYDYTIGDYNNRDELKSGVKFSPEQTKETLDGLLGHVLRVLKSGNRAVPEARNAQGAINWEEALTLLDKTMFVCRSQQQACQVKQYFKATGADVALSTSRFDENSEQIKRFKKEPNCKVLVVVNRGTLGFNMPELVNIVDMSGSRNPNVLFQMFARLVRRHPSGKEKLFLKVVPEAMAEYVYVLMSLVIALSHKDIYETYSGDFKKAKIPVSGGYVKSVQGTDTLKRPRRRLLTLDELPPVPRIEVMKSLVHKTGELLSSYAFTTLEEVCNRLKISFLPFEEARAYARSLGLKNAHEWRAVECPDNVPKAPDQFYLRQWVSWGDWLGTDNESSRNRRFASFEEARAYVRSVGLKNRAEWRDWCKVERPNTIPSAPEVIYKDRWVSLGDWLGTGTVHITSRLYLPFEEARAHVRSLKLKSQTEWFVWAKTLRPDNIPYKPDRSYKKEWVSWGDWLGTGRVYTRVFLSFTEARAYVRSLKLKSQTEWFEWTKSSRPENIPSNPQSIYKDEWMNWGDWLGTGTAKREFLPFKKARAYVRLLGLKNATEWRDWLKAERTTSIPTNPHRFYRDEWGGWGDFLGTGNVYRKNFLQFENARVYARSLGLKRQKEWFEWAKTVRPDNIPYKPDRSYKDQWVSWGDFLGTASSS